MRTPKPVEVELLLCWRCTAPLGLGMRAAVIVYGEERRLTHEGCAARDDVVAMRGLITMVPDGGEVG